MLGFAILWQLVAAGASSNKKPHILMIASDDMRPETVVVRRLSRFLEEDHILGDDVDVSVIKIDTEGFEGAVLRGALPWMRALAAAGRPLPVLIVEVAWGRLHPQLDANLKTFAELAELGFCPIDITAFDTTLDVVVLPRRLDPECASQEVL